MSGKPCRATTSDLTRRQATGLIAGAFAAALAPRSAGANEPARHPFMPTRGFNLPSWVDKSDGRAPSPAVLEKLHSIGFRTVRLPVDGDRLASGDGATRRPALANIHAAVKTLVDHGYRVIVDLHPSGRLAHNLHNRPAEGGDLAATAWRNLAAVVADLPPSHVYAELLNEPPLAHDIWLALRARLAGEIRVRCPHHTLVWGPARYQGLWELEATTPLADDNAIAAVHYYTPMGFTHQGENWDSSPMGRLHDLPFPATRQGPAAAALAAEFRRKGDEAALAYLDNEMDGPWTVAAIDERFRKVGRWGHAHNVPIMLNEFGVLNFRVDRVSRANWIGAVRKAAEANGLGWTHWEIDAGFGFIEDRRSTKGFDRSVIDALMGA